MNRSVAWLLIAGLAAAGCAGPARAVRPAMGDSPITVVPPTPRGGAPEAPPPQLSYIEQVEALLAETDQPVRLRVLAHPAEGDEFTTKLAAVCRDILTLAKTPTRFDLNDPVASPESANEARILGVEPLGTAPGSRRKREPLPMDREYRSLVIAVGTKLLVVPQVTPDRGDLEFQVAEAISRLMHGPRAVGFVTSDETGERLAKLRKSLDRFELQPVGLDSPVSSKLATLVVVGPGKQLARAQVEELQRFLALGGRSALLLIDGMEVDEGQRRYNVRQARSGLEDVLASFGATVRRDLVFDHRCGRVSVPARIGRMLLPYPPIPSVEVSGGDVAPDAREVRLPFPSSIRIDTRAGVEVTPLLSSSDSSWTVESGFNLSPHQQWDPSKRGGPYLLGVVLSRVAPPAAKLAVVANSRFVEDQYLGVSDNAVFVRQTVEWLGGHRALSAMLE
jgi:hypothetical protein